MRFSAASLLVSALGFFSVATAHTIQHKDDLMTVTFQVGDREFGGSGNLEIDFWVRLLLRVFPSPGRVGGCPSQFQVQEQRIH
jgi:hypothetical protein